MQAFNQKERGAKMKYFINPIPYIGNEADGYKRNSVFLKRKTIKLKNCDINTSDTLIIDELKKQRLISEAADINRIIIDHRAYSDGTFEFYIYYDGYNACILRPIYKGSQRDWTNLHAF